MGTDANHSRSHSPAEKISLLPMEDRAFIVKLASQMSHDDIKRAFGFVTSRQYRERLDDLCMSLGIPSSGSERIDRSSIVDEYKASGYDFEIGPPAPPKSVSVTKLPVRNTQSVRPLVNMPARVVTDTPRPTVVSTQKRTAVRAPAVAPDISKPPVVSAQPLVPVSKDNTSVDAAGDIPPAHANTKPSQPEETTMSKLTANQVLVANIAKIAKAKGIALTAVCDKAHLHRSTLNNLEKRKSPPESGMVASVAKALGVESEVLASATVLTDGQVSALPGMGESPGETKPSRKTGRRKVKKGTGRANGARRPRVQTPNSNTIPSPSRQLVVVKPQLSRLLENPAHAAKVARFSHLLSQVADESLRSEIANELAPLLEEDRP